MTRSLLFLCLALGSCFGKVLSVSNKAGVSITIDLIAVNEDSLDYRMIKDGQPGSPATLKMSVLDAESQAKVKAVAATLEAPLPRYEMELVVNNRRKDGPDYSDQIIQNVGGVIRLENSKTSSYGGAVKVNIVYFGSHRRYSDRYEVLHLADFDTTIPVGATVELDVETIQVTWDSDNKGRGNLGGSEYCGLICIATMPDGRIILHETAGGVPKMAVKNDPQILHELADYKKGMFFPSSLALAEALDNPREGADVRR